MGNAAPAWRAAGGQLCQGTLWSTREQSCKGAPMLQVLQSHPSITPLHHMPADGGAPCHRRCCRAGGLRAIACLRAAHSGKCPAICWPPPIALVSLGFYILHSLTRVTDSRKDIGRGRGEGAVQSGQTPLPPVPQLTPAFFAGPRLLSGQSQGKLHAAS